MLFLSTYTRLLFITGSDWTCFEQAFIRKIIEDCQSQKCQRADSKCMLSADTYLCLCMFSFVYRSLYVLLNMGTSLDGLKALLVFLQCSCE